MSLNYKLSVRLKEGKGGFVHLDDDVLRALKPDNQQVLGKAAELFREYRILESSFTGFLLLAGSWTLDTGFMSNTSRQEEHFHSMMRDYAYMFSRSMVHQLVEEEDRHGLSDIFNTISDKSPGVMSILSELVPSKEDITSLASIKTHLQNKLVSSLPLGVLMLDVFRSNISVWDAVSYAMASDVERSFMRKCAMMEFCSEITDNSHGGMNSQKTFRVLDCSEETSMHFSSFLKF